METHDCLSAVRRIDLGVHPTPLHRMERLEQELGHRRIFIKRDDLTGLGPGGNKTRNLEFLLAQCLDQGCDTVVVAGPLQSNLCALTAAACARLELRCEVVLNGERSQPLRGNLLLNELLGARVHYLGPVPQREREEQVKLLADQLRTQGRRPYVIENGGTTGLGALGYASVVRELMEQCAQMGLGPLTIYAPVGNGGVSAGLALGNWLYGMPFRVVAVSVEDDRETAGQHITRTIADSVSLLGCPEPPPLDRLCRLTDEFRGGGWGVRTAESEAAVLLLARLEGILSEHVYTSKVLAGMIAELRRGDVSGDVCFLHTGGIGSLYAQYE